MDLRHQNIVELSQYFVISRNYRLTNQGRIKGNQRVRTPRWAARGAFSVAPPKLQQESSRDPSSCYPSQTVHWPSPPIYRLQLPALFASPESASSGSGGGEGYGGWFTDQKEVYTERHGRSKPNTAAVLRSQRNWSTGIWRAAESGRTSSGKQLKKHMMPVNVPRRTVSRKISLLVRQRKGVLIV